MGRVGQAGRADLAVARAGPVGRLPAGLVQMGSLAEDRLRQALVDRADPAGRAECVAALARPPNR